MNADGTHEAFRRLEDETLECLDCHEPWPCDELKALRARARVEVDDHEPGPRDSDGHLRCGACGYRWPCTTVVVAGRALTPSEEALLDLVEPGWIIFGRQGESDVAPIGGVVLGFVDGDEGRTYTVLAAVNNRYVERRLKAAEVDLGLTQLPRFDKVRDKWRALCADVAKRRGVADSDEVRAIELAFTLTRLGTKGHAA